MSTPHISHRVEKVERGLLTLRETMVRMCPWAAQDQFDVISDELAEISRELERIAPAKIVGHGSCSIG